MFDVTVLIGSLSKDSINRKLARSLMHAGEGILSFAEFPLDHVPMLNQDLEAALPEAVKDLQQRVAASDGVLFVTPEHNRFVPAVVKNAVDWCSRPYGKGQWINKPVALAGISPGASGTVVAQYHLRGLLNLLGARVLTRPELCLTAKAAMFNAEGHMADDSTRSFAERFLRAFADLIKEVCVS